MGKTAWSIFLHSKEKWCWLISGRVGVIPAGLPTPGIVKLYKKYKDKGFEVFAVSIDVKKAAWLKAIRQDKLPYTHVNDVTGWYSIVAESFFVSEIPSSFLLDVTGKLVAVDAEGAELEKLVKTLLK